MLTTVVSEKAYREIWGSLTLRELVIEFTRVTGEVPPAASTSGDLLQRMLAKLRDDAAGHQERLSDKAS